MLNQLNRFLEKIMPLITPASVILGVLVASYLTPFKSWSIWIFAFMTFAGSITFGFRDFMKVLTQPMPLLAMLLILHAVMPLTALVLGSLTFHEDILTVTGLVLGAAIPTGITSFVWVNLYRGSAAITLSIILIDTLLAPFVVPFTLSLLIGTQVHMDIWTMMQGLMVMIVIPSLLGMALHDLSRGKIKHAWAPRLAPFSKVGMALVIMINASVVAPLLRDWSAKLFGTALFVLGLATLGYLLGFAVSRIMRWKEETVTAVTFNSGMRNISAGAVLATAYFPAQVAVPVVLGMLFQQTLASITGHLLSKRQSGTGTGASAGTGAIRASSSASH